VVEGPGSPAVAVGVLDDLRVFIFSVADRIYAPIRNGIGVVQGDFPDLPVIQCASVYVFCNAENLLFAAGMKW